MFDKNNIVYILTTLTCIEKCWMYVEDFDNATDFVNANHQKELNAVISLFIAIGEEVKKIDKSLKSSVKTEINWQDIAKIRDKIAHNYRGIDEEIIWSVIKNNLPLLKESLIQMLQIVKPDAQLLKTLLQQPNYQYLQYLL